MANFNKTTRRGCLRALGIGMFIIAGACLIGEILGMTFSKQYYAPKRFPQTDIVFKATGMLGFVNADGSNLTMVPFKMAYTDFVTTWGTPIITGNNEALIVTFANYPGSIGKVFIARRGEEARDCGWYGIARLATDGYHILLETLDGQEKYLPEDCGTGNTPKRTYSEVVGALSPDEQYSAEVERGEYEAYTSPNIIIHNLRTGEKRLIGEGYFPVWSRDGQWLAYTGADGIYVVQNSPNAKPKRLVALETPHPELGRTVYMEDKFELYYPPIASWSPDGKWLVYHEYHLASETEFPSQYSIVKVNVETGETTKLLDGGYSPFWRWPAKRPGE